MGSVQFEAIGTCNLKTRQKVLIEQYTEACKAYVAVRKDNPSEPKPKKPIFRVLQDKIGGKDAKEKAETLAAKCQEKYEKKRSKTEKTEPEGEATGQAAGDEKKG